MKQLKLSVQEHMVPGNTVEEKFELATSLGYDALEVRGKGDFGFKARLPELQAAKKAGVVMNAVCPDMDHFIGDFKADRRKDAIENMKSQLSVIAALGGSGAITPAAWGMFSRRLPPFTPPRSAEEDREVLLEGLRQLGEHAKQEGVALFLEPINRYENHMICTIAQALELIETVGLSSIKVCADAYHMNIEEVDMNTALKDAGTRLGLLHSCDSNRLPAGSGHIDWQGLLQTLHDMDYDGYVTAEGALQGDSTEALRQSAAYLRGLWQKVTE
ncbi:MAG TPA: sugar phosphate isomerase/epimerase family protein [Candidatus Saccharimonadales bacterium]|nr:sugar phosphate isomerase/epimerase family protein [Candidatus Saccharimonadales bacterium]